MYANAANIDVYEETIMELENLLGREPTYDEILFDLEVNKEKYEEDHKGDTSVTRLYGKHCGLRDDPDTEAYYRSLGWGGK